VVKQNIMLGSTSLSKGHLPCDSWEAKRKRERSQVPISLSGAHPDVITSFHKALFPKKVLSPPKKEKSSITSQYPYRLGTKSSSHGLWGIFKIQTITPIIAIHNPYL
jgi:hypothetical protein